MADNITQAYGGVLVQEKTIREKLFQEKSPTLSAALDAAGHDIKGVGTLAVDVIESEALDRKIASECNSASNNAVDKSLDVSSKVFSRLDHKHPELEESLSKKQPLGDYALKDHEHSAVDINDFVTQVETVLSNAILPDHSHSDLEASINDIKSWKDHVESNFSTKELIDALHDRISNMETSVKEQRDEIDKLSSLVTKLTESKIEIVIKEAPVKTEAQVVETDKPFLLLKDVDSFDSVIVTDAKGTQLKTLVVGSGKDKVLTFNKTIAPYTVTFNRTK